MCGGKVCVRIQPIWRGYIHGDWLSGTTAERVICFWGTQTVSMAACDRCLTMSRLLTAKRSFVSRVRTLCCDCVQWTIDTTAPQRIITRIIRDISRCPHGPVVSKFYCPAPYFYLPQYVGTCLSLSQGCVYIWQVPIMGPLSRPDHMWMLWELCVYLSNYSLQVFSSSCWLVTTCSKPTQTQPYPYSDSVNKRVRFVTLLSVINRCVYRAKLILAR